MERSVLVLRSYNENLKELYLFWLSDNLCEIALLAPRDGSVAEARWPDLV
jgi:hypothetical protein